MKKRLIPIFAAIIIVVMLFAGCAEKVAPAESTAPEVTVEPTDTPVPPSQDIVNQTDDEGEVTIIDVLGNELVLPDVQPTSIVSLTPANTEMLFALGLGGYIVGVDQYSDYPAEAAEIEKIGDFNGPNVEAILAINPDIVFAGNKLQADAIAQLKEVDLSVAAVEATSYEEIFSSIKLVGDLTSTSEKAEEIVALMKEKEAEVVAKAQEYEGDAITAYYVLSAGEYGNWTSGPGSLINDMFAMLNVDVITDIEPSAPWMDFSLETLIAADPDILIVSSMAFVTIEDLCAMEGYKELTACKEGRVYMVDATVTERPSVRIVEGLEEIYNAIYGK